MGATEIGAVLFGMLVGGAIAYPILLLIRRNKSEGEAESLRSEFQNAQAKLNVLNEQLTTEREGSAKDSETARRETDRLESLRSLAEDKLRQHAETTGHAHATAKSAQDQLGTLRTERDAFREAHEKERTRAATLDLDLAAATTRAVNAETSKRDALLDKDAECARLIDTERRAAAEREKGLREGHEAALAALTLAHSRREHEHGHTLESTKQSYERTQTQMRDAHARELVSFRDQIADQKAYIEKCDATLAKAFDEASAKALNEAMKGFNEQAQARFKEEQERSGERSEQEKREIARLLEPMHKELAELEELSDRMEKSRQTAEGALNEKLQRLQQTGESLANALKKPGVRGLWGEGQLKKILDSAGMTEGVHFRVQDHTDEDGEGLRTDVIIMLPKGREVVIDSKAPLDHYSAAMNATTDEDRTRSAEAHARSVRGHLKSLKSKEYWRRYAGSPDCVFLFIPYEGAYQLACEHDKELLADCHAAKVILANPMTLMSLVHVAAYALQEDRMKGDIEKVRDAGMSLCQRLGHVLGLLAKHRKHLGTAVESYNEIVGSVERRLLPSARAMERLGFADAKIANAPTILQANIRILPVGEPTNEPTGQLALPDSDEELALETA